MKNNLRHIFNLKKIILFLCVWNFITFNLRAQTLIPLAETAFEPQLPFNRAYIKQNNIKGIIFDIIDKKDLQVAEDKGLLNYYQFNKDGYLTRFYYTVISRIIQKEYYHEAVYKKRKKISNPYTYTKNEYTYDTVSTSYFYNNTNNLKLKRTQDGVFYESYYYDYNTEGKLNSEKRCKETNVSTIKSDFKLGSQLTISDESYTYLSTGKNQYKKTCLNDENRAYKEIIYNFNNSKQITSINEQYLATWINQKSMFEYNDLGLLTKTIYTSNSNGLQTIMKTYEYDKNNCVLTEKHYKNDVLQKEISYVTDGTKRVTSYLIRDPNEKTIRIVKLYYQFY